MARGTMLYIDVGDLKENMDRLSEGLSTEEMQKALRRAVKKTGEHLRAAATKEIRKKYAVKASKIREVYGDLVINTGSEIKCYLPLQKSRGAIGLGFNSTYEAVVSTQGKNALYTLKRKKDGTKKENRRPRPQARIKITHISRLPIKGDRIHFYVSKGKYEGHVFVRKSGAPKKQISHGVGIAIPQMPLNDAKDGIQKDVRNFLLARVEHEVTRIIKGVAK